jgi:hypothetical protein
VRRLGPAFLTMSLLAGCGDSGLEASSESLAQRQAPLTCSPSGKSRREPRRRTSPVPRAGGRFSYSNGPWSQPTVIVFTGIENGFSVRTRSCWAE